MSLPALPSSAEQHAVHVGVFGLNYRTADAAVREKLAFSAVQAGEVLEKMRSDFPDAEIALLATCNRTEWYYCAPRPAPDISGWLLQKGYLTKQALANNTFSHHDRHAVRHIYRIACGLDSLVLGEPQILGQLKAAYRLAKERHTLGSSLERLFQQSFAVAKQIRSTTAVGSNPVSAAHAGVKLTHQFFDDHEQRSALIIGAGETGQLLARYLHDLHIKRLIIANRTLSKAQLLAEKTGGYAIGLHQIDEHLHEADMIFGAAYSDTPLIGESQIRRSLKARHNAFQVLVDLAMPRLFTADIDRLNHVFLYGVDDLEQIIDGNRESRQKAAQQAEVLINLHSDDFIGWLNSKPQQQLIRQIRRQAETLRKDLLADAYRRLAHGEDPAAILEQMSYKLTNKLIHPPSAMIHAIPPGHKDWLAIVADAFDNERTH